MSDWYQLRAAFGNFIYFASVRVAISKNPEKLKALALDENGHERLWQEYKDGEKPAWLAQCGGFQPDYYIEPLSDGFVIE